MAQLPPKVPNWPDFSHQKIPTLDPNPTTNTHNHNHPSWVDEFLDFSSAKRGSHRRSISDSIAFLEVPMVEECRRSAIPAAVSGMMMNTSHHHHEEFDKFDDDQLMSMFNDDHPHMNANANSLHDNKNNNNNNNMSCSNPSSPSDHNSINDDKISPSDLQLQQMMMKSEPEEVQSLCGSDSQFPANSNDSLMDNSSDKIVDPKRIKRILANRQSAQRSRVRKLQYISELERSVTSLQAEVSVLSPRVAFLDHQRLVLNVDNSVLKQRIAALAQDKIFKDAHQEALKREIERLRQIFYQQNLKKVENGTPSDQPKSQPPPAANEKEQLVN
ncbi:OLC1v1023821C1 [Oldenlandia corymbosa var. corymbosa]|uniref:OLC1v1023821C1 n=1 Tax=Oldenlandia corymbosa var. corymbosa TaxID=529605 RepID=A0AAV1C3M7_OLDCO|nr:OLC1v1023821C1 [Oldenlandia corymbosa var. corymbosa]